MCELELETDLYIDEEYTIVDNEEIVKLAIDQIIADWKWAIDFIEVHIPSCREEN